MISGEINDAKGLPLPGVNVRLYKLAPPDLYTTTDANGRYAFTQLPAPSRYRVQPMLSNCTFTPFAALNMTTVTADTILFFNGSGPGCGGDPAVNSGATSGPLTISGHVRDASGKPIIGASIKLSGSDTAIRFTDFTGGYAFHVAAGTYGVAPTGPCPISPASAKLAVSSNVVQDFAGGTGCVTASPSNVIATGSVFTVTQAGATLGTTYAHVETGVADGAARLQQIAAEQSASTRSLVIAGFPAIERQMAVTLDTVEPELAADATANGGTFLALTAAIAVGSTVVRYESHLPIDAADATIAMFFQADRDFTPDALPDLHGAPIAPAQQIRNTLVPPGSPQPGVLAPGLLLPQHSFGELQIAASDTANVVVYGTAGGPWVSRNAGLSVTASTYNTAPAPGAATFDTMGDPVVTVGAPDAASHQKIYFAQLERVAHAPAGGINDTVAVGLYESTDDGQTFNLNGFPINCGASGSACVLPDQEQLAADRVNQVALPAGNFDQIYLAWRDFTSATTNAHTIAAACSRDGGATWTVDRTTIVETGADFPRVAAGPDGSFVVIYKVTTQPSTASYTLKMQRWSSCANGFTPTRNVQIATLTDVTDMPGLDRPPFVNYYPAFDDSDATGQTLLVVYANEAALGNDDVHVTKSIDGGATWPRDSIVNTVAAGRRYFPSICSTGGHQFVTWYDRRNSSPAQPDLTAFYRAAIFGDGSGPTTVGVSGETSVSAVDDPQCISGFPEPPRTAIELTQCTNLPGGFIVSGTCQVPCSANTNNPCGGSGSQCDLRTNNCTSGERCFATGGGVPKFGDYNISACAQGNLFTAWASATPPATAACAVDGRSCGATTQCCSNNCVAGTCAPTTAACTADGAACGSGQPACCSAGLNGMCQGGICMPSIALYTSCSGPRCGGVPIVTYHQVGACNGYNSNTGGHFVGPNQAVVIFAIERVDNSNGATPFTFDPNNLFVQQAASRFFDSSLSVYPDILKTLAAYNTTTVAAGGNHPFSPNEFGALVVTTTADDGAVEANNTSYSLLYKLQGGDPPVQLVKSNAAQTVWPLTQDCTAIVLQ